MDGEFFDANRAEARKRRTSAEKDGVAASLHDILPGLFYPLQRILLFPRSLLYAEPADMTSRPSAPSTSPDKSWAGIVFPAQVEGSSKLM
jgi:hypothetical protein